MCTARPARLYRQPQRPGVLCPVNNIRYDQSSFTALISDGRTTYLILEVFSASRHACEVVSRDARLCTILYEISTLTRCSADQQEKYVSRRQTHTLYQAIDSVDEVGDDISRSGSVEQYIAFHLECYDDIKSGRYCKKTAVILLHKLTRSIARDTSRCPAIATLTSSSRSAIPF